MVDRPLRRVTPAASSRRVTTGPTLVSSSSSVPSRTPSARVILMSGASEGASSPPSSRSIIAASQSQRSASSSTDSPSDSRSVVSFAPMRLPSAMAPHPSLVRVLEPPSARIPSRARQRRGRVPSEGEPGVAARRSVLRRRDEPQHLDAVVLLVRHEQQVAAHVDVVRVAGTGRAGCHALPTKSISAPFGRHERHAERERVRE